MSKWISIKDKLPEVNTPVLVYMPNAGVRIDWVHPFDNKFFTYRYKQVDDITHWMPLPELPKEFYVTY